MSRIRREAAVGYHFRLDGSWRIDRRDRKAVPYDIGTSGGHEEQSDHSLRGGREVGCEVVQRLAKAIDDFVDQRIRHGR
jgi:hypothetical protein